MRALAALFVVLHHAYRTVWSEYSPNHNAPLWLDIFKFGHFSVTLFIVLSGFCLMMPVVRNGILKGGSKSFYQRRARRILPTYYLALFFSLCLCFTLLRHLTETIWNTSVPVNFSDVAAHLLLIHDFGPAYAINYPLWSVAVECQIYLFFPLFVALWQRWGGWKTTGLLLVISYALALKAHNTPYEGLTFQYYGLFALGMLGAQIALGQGERWETLRQRTPWIPLSLVLLAIVIYKCEQSVDSPGRLMDLLIALASMSLLIVCTRTGTSRARAFLSRKPLVWIGTFSYSIYLIHAPLLQLCWQYGLHPLKLSALWTFGLLAGLGTALIVVISYGFFWFCERPFLPDNALKREKALPSHADQSPAT